LRAVFIFVPETKMRVKQRFLPALLVVAPLSAAAADLSQIQNLNQDDFHKLTQDLGAALSYKPLTPSEPLKLFGFDLGVAATGTKIQNTDVFAKAGASDVSTIVVPQARFNLGLPFGFDVGVMAGGAPGTNVRLAGGELKWAFVSGSTVMPAIAVRGSFTKLGGVDQLDFATKAVDLSISKGFAFFTPYGGIGKVWAESTPKDLPANPNNISKESLSLNKYFIGLNMNFAFVNLVIEGDKTGDATTYGAKLGFRF
jgi:hypothetical protein